MSMSPENFVWRILAVLVAALSVVYVVACTDADVVSRNLSRAADQFEIRRRVVLYNGITDRYILNVEGLCSLGNDDKAHQRTVTCKTGPNAYKKHILGLSDNVTVFAEQLDPMPASPYHYRVIFKPSTIVPDIDLK